MVFPPFDSTFTNSGIGVYDGASPCITKNIIRKNIGAIEWERDTTPTVGDNDISDDNEIRSFLLLFHCKWLRTREYHSCSVRRSVHIFNCWDGIHSTIHVSNSVVVFSLLCLVIVVLHVREEIRLGIKVAVQCALKNVTRFQQC